MDRTGPPGGVAGRAVPVAPAEPEYVVRAGQRAERAERGTDAPFGRGIHGPSVLRQPTDDGGAAPVWLRGESQASEAIDAADGVGGDLPQTGAVAPRPGSSPLPVFAAGGDGDWTRSRMEHRYYLHSAPAGIRLPGGDPGLV